MHIWQIGYALDCRSDNVGSIPTMCLWGYNVVWIAYRTFNPVVWVQVPLSPFIILVSLYDQWELSKLFRKVKRRGLNVK